MSEQPLHVYVHAAETPDKPALRMAASDLVVTFGELEAGSNRIAQLLRSFGLVSGDHLALLMENHPYFLQVCWAAQRSGLFYTPISTRLTADEVAYIARDCGAQTIITSHAMSAIAAELLHQLPDHVVKLMVDGAIEGYTALESMAASLPPTRIPDESLGVDMLYSSGTTGRPKGVLRRPISSSIDSATPSLRMLGLFGFDADSIYLSPAPLYHAAPLRFCMGAQQLGGGVIVMEHFDAEEFLHLVQTRRVTHTQLVPTMFVRMLKLPPEVRNRYDLSSLRCAIHAAAPCPVPIKQQMIDWWGPIIWEYYAATEGNGLTLVNSADWQAHPGTVGRPVFGNAHICSPEGDELPAGATGLVYFADGPAFEYHNDLDKTRASRNAQGWTTLGDIGYLDNDGYLYLTDRVAFTIISGGVNIYPQECENLLITHPKVVDAAVFGVPNEEFGEEVKAVVQPRDVLESGPALEQELIAFCRERLSAIKCPRSIDFEQQLPRSPTGKLHKHALRDRYWTVLQRT
ncbi:MAG: AMP-binding protein [Chloroflexi bacterium]|nr:AMP-binding protein [Chloroflexota bacterium]MBV9894096.1 AMP-binding protein [Chloroflexota bacterium]